MVLTRKSHRPPQYLQREQYQRQRRDRPSSFPSPSSLLLSLSFLFICAVQRASGQGRQLLGPSDLTPIGELGAFTRAPECAQYALVVAIGNELRCPDALTLAPCVCATTGVDLSSAIAKMAFSGASQRCGGDSDKGSTAAAVFSEFCAANKQEATAAATTGQITEGDGGSGVGGEASATTGAVPSATPGGESGGTSFASATGEGAGDAQGSTSVDLTQGPVPSEPTATVFLKPSSIGGSSSSFSSSIVSSGGGDASSSSGDGGLSEDSKVGIGVGLGVGLPALLLAIPGAFVALRQLRRKRVQKEAAIVM